MAVVCVMIFSVLVSNTIETVKSVANDQKNHLEKLYKVPEDLYRKTRSLYTMHRKESVSIEPEEMLKNSKETVKELEEKFIEPEQKYKVSEDEDNIYIEPEESYIQSKELYTEYDEMLKDHDRLHKQSIKSYIVPEETLINKKEEHREPESLFNIVNKEHTGWQNMFKHFDKVYTNPVRKHIRDKKTYTYFEAKKMCKLIEKLPSKAQNLGTSPGKSYKEFEVYKKHIETYTKHDDEYTRPKQKYIHRQKVNDAKKRTKRPRRTIGDLSVQAPQEFNFVPSTFFCTKPRKCTVYRNCPEVLRMLTNNTGHILRLAQTLFCGDDRNDEPRVCCRHPTKQQLVKYSKDSRMFPVRSCGYAGLNLLDKYAKGYLESEYPDCDESLYEGPEELRMQEHLRTKRLAGGVYSRFGQWPWLVSVYRSRRHRCIGTIISDRAIITTGYCIYQRRLQFGYNNSITIGNYDSTNIVSDAKEYQIIDKIKYTIPEPQILHIDDMYLMKNFTLNIYGKKGNYIQSRSNIGIITLKTPIHFNKYVQPICLPTSEAPEEVLPKELDTVTVVAYGEVGLHSPYSSNERHKPRHAELRVLRSSECVKIYPLSLPLLEGFNLNDGICAGGIKKQFLCEMDEGAPLMRAAADGRMFLVGLAGFFNFFGSSKSKCNIVDRPHLFTKVKQHMKFIKNVLERKL